MDAQVVPDIPTLHGSDSPEISTTHCHKLDQQGLATSHNSQLSGANVAKDVPDLDIAGAVKEILQVILTGTTDEAVRLHLIVKTVTSRSMSSPRIWFYIKVITSCAVRKEIFSNCSTTSTPALYRCLRAMQALEDESHLCIQHGFGGQGQVELQGQRSSVGQEFSKDQRSVQQNLMLKGDNLEIHHEVQKRKSLSESTLCLRVHQQQYHMIGQSSKLHKYLYHMKIFKPQSDLSFTIKMGAVSHSLFSVQHWRKVSPRLPSLVTDSAFLLHDSGLLPLQPVTSPYCSGPMYISSAGGGQCTPCTMIEVYTVGQCVPVRRQGSSTGIITLTLFGPGCLPLNVGPESVSSIGSLLNDIDWEKFHMNPYRPDRTKLQGDLHCHYMTTVRSTGERNGVMDSFVASLFLICHASDHSNNDSRYISDQACRILGNHRSACLKSIEEVLGKVLQPLMVAMKNRLAVRRSVRSVSKAVVDVMTLSDNDQFHAALLNSLEVEDSVDLGSSLKVKLLSFSKSHHSALWREHDPIGEQGPTQTARTSKRSNDVIPGQDQSLCFNTISQRTQPAHGNDIVVPGELQSLSRNSVLIPVVTQTLSSPSNRVFQASRERSPFHQLAETNVVHYDPRDKSITDSDSLDKTGERTLNEGEEVLSNDGFCNLSGTRNDSSDFNDLVEARIEVHTSPGVTERVEDDTTPDISRITEAMKDISPFQEFADTGNLVKKRDLDCIPEDPYVCKKIRIQNDSNSEPLDLCGRVTEEQCQLEMFRNMNARTNSERELFARLDPAKPTVCVTASSQVHQGPSDEEILKSKDWDSTFEVVSSFIDTISKGGKLTEEVIAECGSVGGVCRENIDKKKDASDNVEANIDKADGDVNTNVDDSEDWFDKVLLDVENWLS